MNKTDSTPRLSDSAIQDLIWELRTTMRYARWAHQKQDKDLLRECEYWQIRVVERAAGRKLTGEELQDILKESGL